MPARADISYSWGPHVWAEHMIFMCLLRGCSMREDKLECEGDPSMGCAVTGGPRAATIQCPSDEARP